MLPLRVSRWLPRTRAMPKSMILSTPFSATIRFDGLMSRWITPMLWA